MTEHVVVEADGGSRGNPGPAGYGAVVKDAETGRVLAERQAGLGVATNNVAEYSGLIAGLEAAAEAGASTVDVRMDSKLVVEQMSGRWKIKNAALQPLAQRARDLAAGFARVRYDWIPRAQNAHADRLANEAMDTQSGAGGADPEPEEVSEGHGGPDRTSPAGWTGATGTPTRLLLLRHGQTEMSVERRYSGRGDVPLTEHGRGQAEAAATRLAAMDGLVDDPVVVASPLLRAMQTAQAVADAAGGRVSTHPGLVETDFGAWEGLTFGEAAVRDPEIHRKWMSDTSVPPPGGESFDEVHRRVRKVLDELFAGYAGRTVVVVSHVTPIKSLLRLGLDAGPSLLFRLHLDPASLSIADFYPDGNASVRLVNDISHLQ
ncbi:bifunctional RNase H/acid phosphatase [Prauserella muralis]|uniref:Bifunctional RNase H/acid phosphatase n=1 Tax=Prauserella muralis TaxID=588067 RepID=A0A2V4BBH8_9PSEU|nr:bifunctional RNase H/acid phosphatase [Prauserella muralis]PXY32506.1 bifunctional RNase H/acid phosphatase [Prauserella muralis]TWE23789.1 putative phosphoglycerate mutase [Prauserella muralis]